MSGAAHPPQGCERSEDAGTYVLGALPEHEYEAFVAHLAGCAACRDEVAGLQVAVDALPLSAVQVSPPPELRERLMAVVRAEAELLRAAEPQEPATRPRGKGPRRRWWRALPATLRPVPVAIAACALLALGAVGGALLSRSPTTSVPAQVHIASAPSARAVLTIHDGAGRLRVSHLPAPPPGKVYEVWVKRPGRAPAPTDALFSVNRQGSASVAVPGDLDGVQQVLVTPEPSGGSEVPTHAPIIVATRD
jgi:anti-sigma-K factor RskA